MKFFPASARNRLSTDAEHDIMEENRKKDPHGGRPVKRTLLSALAAAAVTALFCFLAVLLLRRLDVALTPLSPALGRIFSALRHARIRPHPLPPFLLLWGAALSLRIRRLPLRLIACAAFVLAGLLAALALTEVNGILFAAVLRSLIGNLLSGALGAL